MTAIAFIQEMLNQNPQIAKAMPQRWQLQRDDFETVVEVFAELALANKLQQVTISRSHNSNIHDARLASANRSNLSALQNTQ